MRHHVTVAAAPVPHKAQTGSLTHPRSLMGRRMAETVWEKRILCIDRRSGSARKFADLF